MVWSSLNGILFCVWLLRVCVHVVVGLIIGSRLGLTVDRVIVYVLGVIAVIIVGGISPIGIHGVLYSLFAPAIVLVVSIVQLYKSIVYSPYFGVG